MGRHRAEDHDGGRVGGTSGRGQGDPDGWQLGGRQDSDREDFNQALADQHARGYEARHASNER